MPSRLLIGATGWLLGAVTATAGSLYAVDQLGEGLLAQHSKRVSVAMVNTELAQENSERPARAGTRSPGPSSRPSASPSRSGRVRAAGTVPGTRPQRPRPSPSAGPGRIMDTAGGQAEAACQAGAARLVYVIPAQGYDIHDRRLGPATVASVTFTDAIGGVVLRVTCSNSGEPVKQVSTFSWGTGSHHDE